MGKIILQSLLIGELLMPVVTLAQAPVPETLDLSWLEQAVLQQNAGLTAGQLRARAMRELVDGADALDDPRLSYAVAPATAGDPIPSSFGDAVGVRQVIQFSQNFPWPGTRNLRQEEASARAEVAEYSYEELMLSLTGQSRKLWAQWWYVAQALDTNRQHQALLSDLEQIAATQYANGLGLQQDLLKIQTDAVALDHQQVVLEQKQRRLRADINRLLNQPPSRALPAPDAMPPERELPATETLSAWLLATQPELLAMEAEANAARTRKELVEKEDYPDIQFNMGYNELMSADDDLRFTVGVSLNLPFDFSGKRSSRKAAADYEYNSMLSDLVQLKSRLEAELEQQLSLYEELQHNIHLFETELLPRAEQTFQAASANYEGGGGNFATLVETQQTLLDLNLHLLEMQAEKLMTYAEIDRLSGGRLWPVAAVETAQ